ncbi:protein CASPARIAN STRIP INTEGRITY FACTOR 1-like [Olea europaea var. sylvestris]|uniref:protein CASPARIAN STRIP INTEGRITY FACTOR 1-like n=1 Tax=Olea europaea var. sylvestris TaxID=158386 RepID=UPI000C1D04F9|nr:protein CASPARIAN STRIP INTEGRITY FACTOR 1-like [Olea europaea var. sylvestris]
MDFFLLKKISLLFLLISASLMSISFAGRLRRSVNTLDQKQASVAHEEHHGKMSEVHERLLRVNTKDYGRHDIDPPPRMVRPPFKPNRASKPVPN